MNSGITCQNVSLPLLRFPPPICFTLEKKTLMCLVLSSPFSSLCLLLSSQFSSLFSINPLIFSVLISSTPNYFIRKKPYLSSSRFSLSFSQFRFLSIIIGFIIISIIIGFITEVYTIGSRDESGPQQPLQQPCRSSHL